MPSQLEATDTVVLVTLCDGGMDVLFGETASAPLPKAKKVLKDVQSKVDGWLAEGRQASTDNPDRASTLLTRVVSILPSDDSRYKQAYKLLNQLAAREDD